MKLMRKRGCSKCVGPTATVYGFWCQLGLICHRVTLSQLSGLLHPVAHYDKYLYLFHALQLYLFIRNASRFLFSVNLSKILLLKLTFQTNIS